MSDIQLFPFFVLEPLFSFLQITGNNLSHIELSVPGDLWRDRKEPFLNMWQRDVERKEESRNSDKAVQRA